MLFHKRAKGKRLAPKKKDTQREKTDSNEDIIQTYKNQLLILRQFLQKIISYFNGNAAGITIAVSGFLAVSTFIMKFFSYCYDRGKVSYWSIDISIIQVFNNNIILEVFFSAIFLAFFLFISGIFFVCLPEKLPKKFSLWLLFLIFTTFLYFFSTFLYFFILNIDFNYKVFLLPLPNLIMAFIIKLVLYLSKSNSHSSFQASGAITLFLMLVASTRIFYQSGLDSSKSQRTFPLLNDTQVVVYSTSTTYYTARYTIDGDTILIDTSHRGTYARADGELEYRTFANVILQD